MKSQPLSCHVVIKSIQQIDGMIACLLHFCLEYLMQNPCASNLVKQT